MANLVTSCLNSSVLHFLAELLAELFVSDFRKAGVVPSVALDTNAKAGLCHSKDECPSILWVQVSVCQHQKQLVFLQLHVLLKVLKERQSMVLLDFGVLPDSRLDSAILLQFGE